MFTKILISLALISSVSALADSRELGNFAGKYRVEVKGMFSRDHVDLLINAKDELKVIAFGGEGAFGNPLVDFSVMRLDNQFGPDALPLASLSIVYGSDEETHTFVMRMAVQRDGNDYRLALVDAIYTVNDGPNSFTSLYAGDVKIEKWNKEVKKFETITKF